MGLFLFVIIVIATAVNFCFALAMKREVRHIEERDRLTRQKDAPASSLRSEGV